MNLKLPIPLRHDQRAVYWKLCRLLSRPELSSRQQQKLKDLISSSINQLPLPFQPSAAPVYPLFFHHLQQSGYAFDQIFKAHHLELQHPAKLIPGSLQRERAFQEFLQAADEKRVPVMLIKGAALRPQYPSPVLRTSSDYDLVVSVEVFEKIERLLKASAWVQRRSPLGELLSVYRHESGALIDLHQAKTNLAKVILDRARPFPHGSYKVVKQPSDADHLLIIALHNAGHGSKKVFRDLTDSRILLNGQSAERIKAQLGVLPLSPTQKQAAQGFFHFVNKDLVIESEDGKSSAFRDFYRKLSLLPLPGQVFERLQPLMNHASPFGIALLLGKDLRNTFLTKSHSSSNFDEWFHPDDHNSAFPCSKLGIMLYRSHYWEFFLRFMHDHRKLSDIEKLW